MRVNLRCAFLSAGLVLHGESNPTTWPATRAHTAHSLHGDESADLDAPDAPDAPAEAEPAARAPEPAPVESASHRMSRKKQQGETRAQAAAREAATKTRRTAWRIDWDGVLQKLKRCDNDARARAAPRRTARAGSRARAESARRQVRFHFCDLPGRAEPQEDVARGLVVATRR